MADQPSLTAIRYTRKMLDAALDSGIPRPTYDDLKAVGYRYSLSTFFKIRSGWAKDRDIDYRREPKCADSVAFQQALAKLEGIDDYEERKRVVREAHLEDLRNGRTYNSENRRVGLSRARNIK